MSYRFMECDTCRAKPGPALLCAGCEHNLTLIDKLLNNRALQPPCAQCGGPHPFDTSIPSVTWNRVIRARGLPDYLCTTCILREFVRMNEGFTATLWNSEFYGINIEVVINSQNAQDAAAVSDENNILRVRIEELEKQVKGAGS